MKTILCISGSASTKSSNTSLLEAIADEFEETSKFIVYNQLSELPLFTPLRLSEGTPKEVQQLKTAISSADAVIISTPEYLHNIPAVLKNALEWMTESGELAEKPVMPITFTPAEPRGEYAMKSLIQSLIASKAKVVLQLPLYRSECDFNENKLTLSQPQKEILSEALRLL